MADITMPQLGETVTEGTITRWAKKVGDRVQEDEVLFEVSTDKVDSEVPAPTSGYLAEILVQEGETVEVGAKLAVISDAAPADGDGGGGAAAASAEAPAEPPSAPAGSGSEGGASPAPEPADAEPAEVAAAAQQGGATEEAASAAGGQPAPEPARQPESAPAAPAPSSAGTRPADSRPPSGPGEGKVLSPVVRRLIGEHGLDPNEIPGTGAGGRITRADVLAFIDARGGATATPAPPTPAPTTGPAERTPGPAPAEQRAPAEAPAAPPAPPAQAPRPSAAAAAPPAQPAPAVRPGERDETIPFSNIRRRTAEHMRRSLDTSAHTLVVAEVDYQNVDKVRLASRDRWKKDEGFSLTYLPFIARAVVDAIREYPRINASVGDNELIVHHYVNLGIAVDLNFEGLIVPVVHDADGKRIRALAREMNDLATRARGKKLGADDISGGTFTITNAGGYGTLLTMPIINQPQVCIMGTEGVRPKPVAVAMPDGSYGIAVHPVGNLAISFDHRANDGAYASAFLAKVREILETRDWAQELA